MPCSRKDSHTSPSGGTAPPPRTPAIPPVRPAVSYSPAPPSPRPPRPKSPAQSPAPPDAAPPPGPSIFQLRQVRLLPAVRQDSVPSFTTMRLAFFSKLTSHISLVSDPASLSRNVEKHGIRQNRRGCESDRLRFAKKICGKTRQEAVKSPLPHRLFPHSARPEGLPKPRLAASSRLRGHRNRIRFILDSSFPGFLIKNWSHP